MELTKNTAFILAAESVPTAIEGQEINTGHVYQQIGGTPLGGTALDLSDSQSALGSSGVYAINEGEGAKQVFHLGALVENTGTMQTTALLGKAIGPHTWGGVIAAFTEGSGISRGLEVAGGRRPVTMIAAEEVELKPGGSLSVETTTPNGRKIPESGEIEIGNAGRRMMYAKYIGNVLEGCEILHGGETKIKKGANLHVSGGVAIGLLLVSAGGNLNGGKGLSTLITFELAEAGEGRGAENGIVWPAPSSGTQIVKGSLWLVEEGLEVPYCLNLEKGKFTTAAITLGDNNITTGTVAGAKIATATTQKLGFWGATPVTRPVIKGELLEDSGPASIAKALAEMGLITNETTEGKNRFVVQAKAQAPETIEGSEVSTVAILQSIGKASPFTYGLPGIGTAATYNDSSGPTIMGMLATVENTGTVDSVACYGRANGPAATGGVFSGYTEGSGRAEGLRVNSGNLPLTVLSAEEVTLPEKGGSLTLENSEPDGMKLGAPGRMEIGSSGRTFTYEKLTGNRLEGITITAESKLVKKGANLHGTSGVAYGVVIESFGGQLAGGSGLEVYLKMVAQANSAALAGISIEKNGSAQPLTSTGSFIVAQSGIEAAYGLNLEKGTWTAAAIALGDNSVAVGEGTGAMVATSTVQKLGFWGAAPIAQPEVTGEIAEKSATASLFKALAKTGLIKNATTESLPPYSVTAAQKAVYASARNSPPTDLITMTKEVVYLTRFTVSEEMKIKSVTFAVNVASSKATDTIDVAVWVFEGSKFKERIFHSGPKEGMLNAKGVGMMGGEFTLKPNTVYYTGVLTIFGETAPVLAGFGGGSARGYLLDAHGLTSGKTVEPTPEGPWVEQSQVMSATMPTEPGALSALGGSPVLCLREFT